jgi:hypothetical protein
VFIIEIQAGQEKALDFLALGLDIGSVKIHNANPEPGRNVRASPKEKFRGIFPLHIPQRLYGKPLFHPLDLRQKRAVIGICEKNAEKVPPEIWWHPIILCFS